MSALSLYRIEPTVAGEKARTSYDAHIHFVVLARDAQHARELVAAAYPGWSYRPATPEEKTAWVDEHFENSQGRRTRKYFEHHARDLYLPAKEKAFWLDPAMSLCLSVDLDTPAIVHAEFRHG